jgi:hypothetical protein
MSQQVSFEMVAELADRLPAEDRRRLAVRILDELSTSAARPAVMAGRSWREIRGSVPHPMFGEDAQAWVSRGRREDDERHGSN